MIHREIVVKKRTPVVVISLFIITFILYIVEGIERSKYSKQIIGDFFYIGLTIMSIALIVISIRSCLVSYKYIAIADKLIINAIRNNNEINMESIRMSDILFLGESCEMPRKYYFSGRSKKYLCNRIGQKSYYCVYQSGDTIKKIKFQPSEKFINRVIKHGKLNCELVR